MNRLGAPRAAGFTIIEVMLFLAISGAMVVALLSSVGFAVTRQRFSDSIFSAQAFVQSQYNETLNVVNDRSAAGCNTGGTETTNGSGTIAPGASDCVVLGRALDFTTGSSHVTTYAVIGKEPATPPTGDVVAQLTKYHPGIDSSSAVGYDIPWDQQVWHINPSATRVLLLRSPDSGLVVTFAGSSVSNAISQGIRTVNLCMQSQDVTNTVAMVSFSPTGGTDSVVTKFGLTDTEQAASC